MFDEAPAAMIVSDRAGIVRMWNRAAEILTGWRADEVVGRELPYVPTEHLEAFRARHAAAFEQGEIPEITARRLRKDGRHRGRPPKGGFVVVGERAGALFACWPSARVDVVAWRRLGFDALNGCELGWNLKENRWCGEDWEVDASGTIAVVRETTAASSRRGSFDRSATTASMVAPGFSESDFGFLEPVWLVSGRAAWCADVRVFARERGARGGNVGA